MGAVSIHRIEDERYDRLMDQGGIKKAWGESEEGRKGEKGRGEGWKEGGRRE